MKHLDFMIVDLIALFISFVLSYWMKFGDIGFISSESWLRLLLIISLLNLIIALFTNPYSGIFRRSYYQEIKTAFELSVINLAATSVLIYLFKMGAEFSREAFFVMYGLYFLLSLALKYIWKKLLISRKITVNTTRPIPLFVICDSQTIEKTLNNISAGDFKLYDIKGIHLTDNTTKTHVLEVPVISSDFVEFILNNNMRSCSICHWCRIIFQCRY